MEFDKQEQRTKEFQQGDTSNLEDRSIPPPVLEYLGLQNVINAGAGQTSSEREADQLMEGLESKDWTVRVATVRKLGKLRQQAPVERLCILLREDEHQSVRAATAQALGSIRAQASVAPLIAALQDTSWHVRTAAVTALGKQIAQVQPEPLVAALNDEDDSVRTAAAWAVGQLGNRAPLVPLLAALHDPAWMVRESAARAAGKLGARVPHEPLLTALSDQDEQVRAAAAWALQQLPSSLLLSNPARSIEEAASLALNTPATRSDREQRREDEVVLNDHTTRSDEILRLSRSQNEESSLINGRVTGSGRVEQGDEEENDEHITGLRPRRLPVVTRRTSIRRGLERSLVAALIAAIGLSWLVVSHWPGTTGSGDSPDTASMFRYQAPSGTVTGVVWASPQVADDEKGQIAFATGNGWVQVWDTSANKLITTYGPFKKVLAMNWPTSGLQIAALTNDGTLQLLQGESMQPFLSLRYGSSVQPLVSWSPDGKRVAFTTPMSNQGTVSVWTLATRTSIVVHPSRPGTITSIAWSSSNTELATASDDGVLRVIDIWSAVQGTSIAHPMPVPFVPVPFRVLNMAWSSDGVHLAYALDDGEVRIWDRRTYDHLLLHASDQDVSAGTTSAGWSAVLAWSPDGKRLAVTTPRGAVQIWDAATGDLLMTYKGHRQQVDALMWSSDGKRIVSADDKGLVLVWKEE